MKWAAGFLLLITGAIWVLQGLDVAFAPNSFMTGNRAWVLWGTMALAGGVGLIWWARRSG
jgi:hypothetical protein